MVTRPASDPYLVGYDPTLPVTFGTPPDPTRPDPRHLKALLTREKPWMLQYIEVYHKPPASVGRCPSEMD